MKATSSGKVYVLQYRIGRRKRRVTIGQHGMPWTVEAAGGGAISSETSVREAMLELAIWSSGRRKVGFWEVRNTRATGGLDCALAVIGKAPTERHPRSAAKTTRATA